LLELLLVLLLLSPLSLELSLLDSSA